jgi:hypothetical protein
VYVSFGSITNNIVAVAKLFKEEEVEFVLP